MTLLSTFLAPQHRKTRCWPNTVIWYILHFTIFTSSHSLSDDHSIRTTKGKRSNFTAPELFTSKSRQSTANEEKKTNLCGRKTIEPTVRDLWASFNRFKYFPFQMFNIQLISHTLSLFICLSAITFTFYDSTVISSVFQQIIDSI